MTPVAVVRYGRLRRLAEFAPRGETPKSGRAVVVSTPRGVELGQVLAVVERDAPREVGTLVRLASVEDEQRGEELRLRALDELITLRDALGGLLVVGLEWLLDGEHAVLYYAATERVDVPAVLKQSRELLGGQVRLEQVGARQRASMCDACGVCGRALCCATFLRTMRPVTMRMAKVQGLDLSPSRTAGACGRLKCCLRYEHPLYEEASRGMPRVGWTVRTERLSGEVLAVDPLRRRVLVRPPGRTAQRIFPEEVLEEIPPAPKELPVVGKLKPVPVVEDELEEPEVAPAEPAPEPGWSQFAKRLWSRVGRRKDKTKDDPPPEEG